MKDFTSYFIGISLPTDLQKEFEMLLEKVSILDPGLTIVNPKTPHITVYYLTKFPKIRLSELRDLLASEVGILANAYVTVGNLGVFGGENPKTIFLDTQCPKELKQFRENLSKILTKNTAQDNFMPFYPHMTVATIKAENYEEEFTHLQPKLKELLNNISWTFSITEIAIYGANSTQSPEYQEKLATILVN